MTQTPYIWPRLLRPRDIEVNMVPFSRSSGMTLGGLRRAVRTDRGFWRIVYRGVPLWGEQRRRLWNQIAVGTLGQAGLLAIPAWSFDTVPWPPELVDGEVETLHSDDTPHDDDTPYVQPAMSWLTMAEPAALGATSIKVRISGDLIDAAGLRFSYQHALYMTGAPTAISGAEWTVPVFPAIRAAIPDEAALEIAVPTCLVRLAADSGLDARFSRGGHDRVDVTFIEAADYWSAIAVSKSKRLFANPGAWAWTGKTAGLVKA